MRALIWNSEGFRDTAKHCFIKESIRDHKLDIVAFLETGRANFSEPFLRGLAAGQNFMWYCLPPHGRSGGILVGFNAATISVKSIEAGDYIVKFHLSNKCDAFEWSFAAVYGAAQDAQKQELLAELVRMGEDDSLPRFIAGDFNIIQGPHEKIIVILMGDGLLCLMQLSRV